MRLDSRYFATVSLGEAFFAFALNAVNAFEESAPGEKIYVYAVMSTEGTWRSVTCARNGVWPYLY